MNAGRSDNHGAQRSAGEVVLYLSPRHPTPTLPYEFSGIISHDDWAVRIPAIISLASQYYKPRFERIWTLLAMITCIILPFGVYHALFDPIDFSKETSAGRFFIARFVGLATFIGTLVFFYVPILVWKSIGKKRMDIMLRRWARADLGKNFASFTPQWRVERPTVFKSQIILHITTPPNVQPTLFHPDAYLPSFINGPADVGAAYPHPYVPNQPGAPRISVVESLPPAYSQSDMKNRNDEKV